MNKTFKYFKYDEFADRYSGKNRMRASTIRRLDRAREIAGVPFVINSGYRDDNHPETLKNPTSSHNTGYAVDIRYRDDEEKDKIIHGLKKAGFLRFGIGSNFIHADDDPTKSQYLTWFYDGTPLLRWA